MERDDDQLNENNNFGFPAISLNEAHMTGNYDGYILSQAGVDGDELKLTDAHFLPGIFGIGLMEVPSELTSEQNDHYQSILKTSKVYERFQERSQLNRQLDFINYREGIVLNKKPGKMVDGNDLKDMKTTSLSFFMNPLLSSPMFNDEKKVISSENKLQELKKRYDVLKEIIIINSSNPDISTKITEIERISIAIKLHRLMSFTNIVNAIGINPGHFTGLLKAYNQDAAQPQQRGSLISSARLLDILKDEDLVGKVISEKFENVTLQQLSTDQENENGAGENQSLTSIPSSLVTAGLWKSSSSSSSTCSSSASTLRHI